MAEGPPPQEPQAPLHPLAGPAPYLKASLPTPRFLASKRPPQSSRRLWVPQRQHSASERLSRCPRLPPGTSQVITADLRHDGTSCITRPLETPSQRLLLHHGVSYVLAVPSVSPQRRLRHRGDVCHHGSVTSSLLVSSQHR